MKTKNNSRETVDDQIKRRIIFGSAVIFSLVLINLPVDARIFRKHFSNRGTNVKLEWLAANQSSETAKTTAAFERNAAVISEPFRTAAETFVCEPEQDKEIRLEAWMTDESNFNSAVDFDTAETDKALSVEDWMISNPIFSNLLVDDESVESDKPLKIESWMLADKNFSIQ